MELYDLMKNLRGLNKEEIKLAIKNTKQKLNNLTEERTCFIYSSYIYEELKNKHISSRIISNNDFSYEYEHRFILVPNTEEDYYLIDLTFSQFPKNENIRQIFKPLIENGYQIINNDLWEFYLDTIINKRKATTVSLENVFYTSLKQQSSISKI